MFPLSPLPWPVESSSCGCILGFITSITLIDHPALLKAQHFQKKDKFFLFAKCWGSDLTNNLFQKSSWPLERPHFFSVTAEYLEKDQYKWICRLCSNFGPCWPPNLLTQPPTYWKWHQIILQIFHFLVFYLHVFFGVRWVLESNQETQEIQMFNTGNKNVPVAWSALFCSHLHTDVLQLCNLLCVEKQIPAF